MLKVIPEKNNSRRKKNSNDFKISQKKCFLKLANDTAITKKAYLKKINRMQKFERLEELSKIVQNNNKYEKK